MKIEIRTPFYHWAMYIKFSAIFYKHNTDYDLKYLLLSGNFSKNNKELTRKNIHI